MSALRLALAGQALIEQPVDPSDAAARLMGEVYEAHMALTNFEATLSAPQAWPVKMKTLHVAEEGALASLRKLGFNTLALANNHAYDLGPPGLAATRAAALGHGFAVAGSGSNLQEAGAPAVIDSEAGHIAVLAYDLGAQADMVYAAAERPGINPLRIRKALALPPQDLARLQAIARACGYEERMAKRIRVGYSDAAADGSLDFFGVEVRAGPGIAEQRYADHDDLARALQAVAAASAAADLLAVSLHHHHWEADWQAAPEWLQGLACQLVEAGADVVYCHGAPVFQGMALHRGRPIFYGMGNFIFHTHRAARYDAHHVDVWRSVLALCDFGADRRLRSARILPLRVGLPLDKAPGAKLPPAPEWLDGMEAWQVLDRFLSLSQLPGCSVHREADHCRIEVAS